jgi:hypothetical protein
VQFTRLTIFHLFYLIGMCVGVWAGVVIGHHFGTVGTIIGVLLGLFLGAFVGGVPSWLGYRWMFREIENSSNERLRQIVDERDWDFRKTLALLTLSARKVDVSGDLARIVNMLESDSSLVRVYGFDAMRLVFTDIARRVPQYDPRGATENCRRQIAELRELMRA